MSATRLLVPDDGPVIAELLRRNRSFLAPCQPRRSEKYFTDEAQMEAVGKALEQHAVGNCVPLAIQDGTKGVARPRPWRTTSGLNAFWNDSGSSSAEWPPPSS
jgi:ribosomal-protein-alanine N-acetyltransferase